MEFEEVQNIWSAQNKQMPYNIDTAELHRRILSKKAKALRITNFTEWLIIMVWLGAGIFTLWTNTTSARQNFFIYCLSAWMFVVALLVVIGRVRRRAASRQFDRSVQGELQYGLAVADYQVRLSQLMRWNIFVIGGLILFGLWEGEKPWWTSVGVVLFLLGAWYASGFENRIYRRQKRRLEELRDLLNA
ncbi:MAG: hypothetical protein BGO55_24370 [Sphingobacteriales bacterium 50-39]|nr:hypothetical protein [Sphingobacteriales bacterium]OJW58429.1 MAG: hypothetical protein BGO55_24370 [Sphingobacteriales bacterium 50-39]